MEMNAIDTTRAAPAEAAFTVGRDALAPALDFLARIVEPRNTIPILSSVLLIADPAEGLTLIGTDLDIMGTVQLLAAVDSPGRFAVELETLRDFVRKVPKRDSAGVPQISFSEKAGRVTVAAGRARSTLNTRKASDFPIMRALENAPAAFDGDAPTWLHDLERVGRAISTEETRYYLNGIFVHVREGALAMAATDGHRLARVVRPLPEGAADLPDGIIPRKTVGLLSRLLKAEGGTFRAYMNETRVAFQAGAYRLDSKLIDGSFPDYTRVIPDPHTFEHALTIDAAAIIAATDGFKRGRAKTASAEMLAIDADAERLIYGNVGPDGAFAAPLDATYTGPGGRFGFNAGYLRDVGAIFGAGPVTFRAADPKSPFLVQSDSAPELTFVQMPMRRDDEGLPDPVVAPVAPVYEAPDGQAADLWSVLPHGTQGKYDTAGSLTREGPREAYPCELAAYSRDYARRCGLAGADRLAVAALGSGRVQFGKCVAEARLQIVERLNWETLTSESEAVQIAAEYETGAFCLTLPGGGKQAPVTVSLDGGPEQVVAADHNGDVRKALTAIMGPDVKLSRAEKAALKERDRARNAPAQPEAVEPVRKPKAAAVKRAERALAMLTGARSGMGTRAFDDCFEMGDGADVAAVMVERIRADRDLAWRVYYGKSRFRDCGETIEVYARNYLSPALWAAVLDSIGNMPTSVASRDSDFQARVDALRVNVPDAEPAADPAPEEPAPDERDISAPEPENVLSEAETGPADDISAQPDPAPAEPAAPDDLAARVAALEALVSQLLSGRAEAEAVADAPEPRERRRDDPARIRMIRRYLAMRAERATLRKQNGALRQKRRSLIGLALSLRSALLRSRRTETAARAEARTATRSMNALQERAARLQRRVEELEQWEEDSRERIAPPAPRTFPSLRMVKG